MSYIDNISQALILVLTKASDGSPEKFTGYAANRDFWVAETAHCLDVISGYSERFERMKEASQASRPPHVDWSNEPISDPSVSNKDLARTRTKVRDAARRFLARCLKMFPEEQYAIFKDAKKLGVPVPP